MAISYWNRSGTGLGPILGVPFLGNLCSWRAVTTSSSPVPCPISWTVHHEQHNKRHVVVCCCCRDYCWLTAHQVELGILLLPLLEQPTYPEDAADVCADRASAHENQNLCQSGGFALKSFD